MWSLFRLGAMPHFHGDTKRFLLRQERVMELVKHCETRNRELAQWDPHLSLLFIEGRSADYCISCSSAAGSGLFFTCNCPDFEKTGEPCKHLIFADITGLLSNFTRRGRAGESKTTKSAKKQKTKPTTKTTKKKRKRKKSS